MAGARGAGHDWAAPSHHRPFGPGTDLRPERRTELADLIAAEEQRANEALERVETLRSEVEVATAASDNPEGRRLQHLSERWGTAVGIDEVVGPA